MIIKIKTNKINIFNDTHLVYFCFLIFSTTSFIQIVPAVNTILNLMRILLFCVLINNYFFNNSLPKVLWFGILLQLVYMFSGILNSNMTVSFWFHFINRIGIMLFAYGGIKENAKKFLKCGRNFHLILLIVNILYMIFAQGIKMSIGEVYPLGLRINFTNYVYLAILFAVIYDNYVLGKWISKVTVVVIILGILNLTYKMVATGLIGMIIALIFFVLFFVLKPKKYWPFFLMPIIAFFSIVVYQNTKSGYLIDFLDLFGKDLTFNNRIYIWESALEAIKNKSILGYGTADLFVDAVNGYHPAHNEILNVLLYGGIIALILFVLLHFAVIKSNEGKTSFLTAFFMGTLISICFMMITEIQSTYNGFYLIMVLGYYIGVGTLREEGNSVYEKS